MRSLVLVLAAAGLLLLSGCRTYGKFGAEAQTYRLLEKMVQSFDEDLTEAKQDVHRLEEAVAAGESLKPMVDRYHSLIHEHQSLLQKQQSRVERLSPDAGYRSIHRAFGATITEQRMMERSYRQALQAIRVGVQDTSTGEPAGGKIDRRYMVKPIGFPKLKAKNRLTMEQALSGQ